MKPWQMRRCPVSVVDYIVYGFSDHNATYGVGLKTATADVKHPPVDTGGCDGVGR